MWILIAFKSQFVHKTVFPQKSRLLSDVRKKTFSTPSFITVPIRNHIWGLFSEVFSMNSTHAFTRRFWGVLCFFAFLIFVVLAINLLLVYKAYSMLELTAEKVIALSPSICLLRGADCIFLSVLELDQRLAQFLAIKYKAVIHIWEQVFVWTQISFLWNKCPRA